MLESDPVGSAEAATTPLFRVGGQAIRRDHVANMVKRLMQRIGLDPRKFGAHSLRIGGATAALAAGVQPAVIRITGRWSSDCWELYARLSKEAALNVTTLIGSTAFEDAERGFVSEEFEFRPSESSVFDDVGFEQEGGDTSGEESDVGEAC